MEQAFNYIAGEFRAAVGGLWLAVDDPSTGEEITNVADSGIMDVVGAVQAANKAMSSWLKTDEKKRASLLDSYAESLSTHAEHLARLEAQETGVTLAYAKEFSLPRSIELLRFYARVLRDPSASALVNTSAYFLTNRLPIGVVVVLSSYSDPIVRFCTSVGAALAGGNAVIVKASSRTPQTSQALAHAAQDAGLPPGVLSVLQGRGEEVGRALVNHPGLSTISFTGRTETAREIQASAAEFLKRTQLNLGGSNAVLVFAENDLPKVAAKVAHLVFAPQGPVTLRGARVLIQESVYDAFLELLKLEAAKLISGDPLDPKTHLGPVVKQKDFKAFSMAVSQALKERAKPLCGGPEPLALEGRLTRGRFVSPTALYDLTFCSTLQQEEVIGPIATVASFKYQHDAIKHANNSPFGQCVYLFHGNAAKAAKIALKLEAGRVFVGGGPLWDHRLSHGGLKTSGHGQQGALESLRFFTRETSIGFDISG